MATTTARKLKIIPGRGLTGRDIKNRLRNRTLEGQAFGDESYTLDESMVSFTKLTKVEQIEAARKNGEKVREIKRNLEGIEQQQRKRQEEAEIERKVQAKLQEIARQQFDNNQNQPK